MTIKIYIASWFDIQTGRIDYAISESLDEIEGYSKRPGIRDFTIDVQKITKE